MKKEQFRSLVKEIIKEVIDEMPVGTTTEELKEMDKQHSQYPKDDPAGTEDGKSGEEKIKSRQAAWKSWAEKKKALAAIHDEPEFQSKMKQQRMKTGDEPLPHKTITTRGS